MEDEWKVSLQRAGIDVDDAVERFMGNDVLFIRMLKKFPSDESFSRLQAAIEDKEADVAFAAAHTLKGLSDNLSMKDLTREDSHLVELLRAGNLEDAVVAFPNTAKAYEKVISAIATLQ